MAEIASLLNDRERHIDFGTFPTEYTDQQFLSLKSVIARLKGSHELVCGKIANAVVSLRTAGDEEAADLLATVESHERDILKALGEIESDLMAKSTTAGT